jgi:cell division septal protein FtsQ
LRGLGKEERRKGVGRKRRKKNGRGIVAEFGSFIVWCFRGFLKVLPVLIILALIAGAVLGARAVLYADSNFNIQQIRLMPGTELSQTTRQDLESKYYGKNLLTVDLRQIATRLRADPAVEWARAERQFPSALLITVKRRIPAAYVRFSPRGDLGLVSDDGMILDVTVNPRSSEPVIEAYALNVSKPRIGYQIQGGGFDEAVKFIREYGAHPAAEKEPVASLSIDAGGNVSVLLVKGPLVRLGRRPSERIGAFEKLISILQAENREAIEYVDLQFDDIVIKQKGSKG